LGIEDKNKGELIMRDNNLKSKLIEWKENDWNIPEEVNKYELSLALMELMKSY